MRILNGSILVVLLMASFVAKADEYLDCTLEGQSDSVVSAPTSVYLDLARGWSLREDGREIHPLRAKVVRQGIVVVHRALEGGARIRYSYVFDDRRCDQEQVGSAVLVKTLESGAGASDGTPSRATSIYHCTCAVD